MGLLALLTLLVYDRSFELMEYLMNGLARNEAGYLLFNLSGQAIAALVMLPATFCAGMTLPLLTGALLRRNVGEGAIGQVYAANTLGAIAGVLLAVHIGLPVLGLKGAIVVGSLVDAGLGLLPAVCLCRAPQGLRARGGGQRHPVRADHGGVQARRQQDDRRGVPAWRPGELARRQGAVRKGRQDRHRAPDAVRRPRPASAPTASPTARSTSPGRRKATAAPTRSPW